MRRGRSPIFRPRLAEQAHDVLRARVTLLVAPPGSGKTVLLDQWAAQWAGRAEVVRLRLGFEHNDPVRFQTDLLAAAADQLPLLHDDPGEATPASVTGFVAAIQARRHPDRPLVFIFDRFEQIVDAIIPNTIMAALQLAPPGVGLVLSGRVAPNILVGELRGRGELLDIGFEQLRLNRQELEELAAAQDASADAGLVERESLGWPVAAWPLMVSDAAWLADYIDDEVLSGLSANARVLVEEAAVPETIPQTVAETTFGVDPARGVRDPAHLQGLRLPIVQDEDAHRWRLPPVLRRRLIEHLRRRDPARLRALSEQLSEVAVLSRREREGVALLDEGLTAADVAARLGVSFHTVKAHVRSIYDKLGVSTRVLALRRARAQGLLGRQHDARKGARG